MELAPSRASELSLIARSRAPARGDQTRFAGNAGKMPASATALLCGDAGARRRLWNAPGRIPMQASARMRTSVRTRRLFAESGREPSISADACRFGA